MAIHYVGNIRHITCQTKAGKRRSPMSDIAYNSGQTLTDTATGRKHCRPHTDGTVIIATDIVSADPKCKYGDRSVPSAQRREQMYNELVSLNKKQSERVYMKTEIALPNSFTDKQLVEASEAIALSLSQKFQRPFDFSVHKKAKTRKKPANNHIHISAPERKHKNGQWAEKSVSYYVSMDGDIIFDKQYKDVNGNDIRRPRIVKGTPQGHELDKDANGNYKYQVRDKKGRRKWAMSNVEGLTPADVRWIHNEVDRINNMILAKYHIADSIQRNDPRVTKALKDLGMAPQKIGYKDAKEQGQEYQEKTAHNDRSKKYRDILTENFTQQDIAEHNLRTAESAEQEADSQTVHAGLNRLAEEISVNLATTDYQDAVKDYVESELLPEEIFVENAVSELDKQYLTARRQTIYTATRFLQSEEKSAEQDIRKIAPSVSTPRERAILKLLQTNKNTIGQLFAKIKKYADRNILTKIKSKCRSRWRGFSKREKLSYIQKYVGEEASDYYADYLGIHKGVSPCPSHFRTDMDMASIATMPSEIQKWKTETSGQAHLPPVSLSPLQTIAITDALILGQDAEPLIPADYDAYAGLKEYQATLNSITLQEEAKRPTTNDKAQRQPKSTETVKRLPKDEKANVPAETQATRLSQDQPSEATFYRYVKETALKQPYEQDIYDRISAITTRHKTIAIEQTADAVLKAGSDYTREELIKRYKSSRHSIEFRHKADVHKIDLSEYDKWGAIRTDYYHISPQYLAKQQKDVSQDNISDRATTKPEQNR